MSQAAFAGTCRMTHLSCHYFVLSTTSKRNRAKDATQLPGSAQQGTLSRLTTGGEPPSRKATAENAKRGDCILPSTCTTCVLPGAPFTPNACECNRKARTVQTSFLANHRHAACPQLLLLMFRAWRKRPAQPCAAAQDQTVAHTGRKFIFAVAFPMCVHSGCWLVCRSCCDPLSQDLLPVNSAASNN